MSFTWASHKKECRICHRRISANSLGYNSHMKMHVRKGEAYMVDEPTGRPSPYDKIGLPELHSVYYIAGTRRKAME